MCAFRVKDPELKTVEDIVVKNTGMCKELLEYDTTRYEIQNLQEAADIIYNWKASDPIYIRGDYDVDGQTSTAILWLAIRSLYWRTTEYFIPKRSDGYGVTMEEIEQCNGNSLLILVDNGISAFEQVKRAKKKGLTVIILDHHLPVRDSNGNAVLPDADVIVDPHVFPGTFNDYCGAGLSYKLVERLICEESSYWPTFKALAAIGTICDCMPLTWENRRIVKAGLKSMNEEFKSLMVGLQCLINAHDLYGHVDAKSIGFKIGPCLNAVDRLSDGGCARSMDILMYRGRKYVAKKMAESILAKNAERKELTERWFNATKEAIKNNKMENDYPIVLSIPGIHEGIIGIIAGKTAELYQTPTIILSGNEDDEIFKGSGRSFGDVHLKDLLDRHADLIERYGGHAGAAGLSIKPENVSFFREALNSDLGEKPEIVKGETEYDLEISGADISETIKELKKFEPYGEGNPSPMFLINGLMVIPNAAGNYRLLSAGGLRISTNAVSAITFEATAKYLSLNCPGKVNLVGTLSLNHFRGNATQQLEFVDVEPAKTAVQKSALQLALERKAQERYV